MTERVAGSVAISCTWPGVPVLRWRGGAVARARRCSGLAPNWGPLDIAPIGRCVPRLTPLAGSPNSLRLFPVTSSFPAGHWPAELLLRSALR
jgi:hypothetical protein